MHDGKYEPQTAFLRMKQDITSGNPQMWDLAAYRIPKKQKPLPPSSRVEDLPYLRFHTLPLR
ncbi:Glutaminyl-tRNA synthetase [Fusarium oxysporum]|nr:Glutaminyl-tRNA synthetase [Fusarium oxysporum]